MTLSSANQAELKVGARSQGAWELEEVVMTKTA